MSSQQQQQRLLLDALRSADLEAFFLNFTMRGINSLEALSVLPVQEYGKFGFTQVEDRKRLFHLISDLKQDPALFEGVPTQPAPAPVPAKQPSSSHVTSRQQPVVMSDGKFSNIATQIESCYRWLSSLHVQICQQNRMLA